MRRPLPTLPRGPRRSPRPRPNRVLLACPRVSPEWELGALRALMKPQEKGAILHRPAEQPWPAGAEQVVDEARGAVHDRLGFDARPHLPDAGAFWLVAEVRERDIDAAKALALLLSTRLPGLWF